MTGRPWDEIVVLYFQLRRGDIPAFPLDEPRDFEEYPNPGDDIKAVRLVTVRFALDTFTPEERVLIRARFDPMLVSLEEEWDVVRGAFPTLRPYASLDAAWFAFGQRDLGERLRRALLRANRLDDWLRVPGADEEDVVSSFSLAISRLRGGISRPGRLTGTIGEKGETP